MRDVGFDEGKLATSELSIRRAQGLSGNRRDIV